MARELTLVRHRREQVLRAETGGARGPKARRAKREHKAFIEAELELDGESTLDDDDPQ
jgi:hypothetical protein